MNGMSPLEVLRFRIHLDGIRPLVWRRFRVPDDLTLAQLHDVIQAAMDWQGFHLHEFTFAGQAYGVPDPDYDGEREVMHERSVRLRDLGLSAGDRLEYLYDFGDNWRHVLELEEVFPCDTEDVNPLCLGGECCTPPEDVGGVSGYEEFLEALSDPNHEEHDHMKSWAGRRFDANEFSLEEANARLHRRFRRRKLPPKKRTSGRLRIHDRELDEFRRN
jgi:hypothetical protein